PESSIRHMQLIEQRPRTARDAQGGAATAWRVRDRQEARGTTGTSRERCRGQWGELIDPRH
ncbi:hypothetical protein KI387_015072, partial [Taxus chinensis]